VNAAKWLQKPAILRVARAPGNPSRGLLRLYGVSIPVALGRGGIQANKREGDGATPRGRFRLLRLWFRADRMPRPKTRLPVRAIRERRRLVRGSGRPPLQSCDQAIADRAPATA
jgi:L,D-peptidoglycan transpeptidase YkuD (ErfK/YbiS/YcfS/YnhG family)